jgi:hypothetical protein
MTPVSITTLLHVSTYMRDPFLKLHSADEVRAELDVYTQNEVDDLVAGVGGTTISDYVRSILNVNGPSEFRDAIDVYSRSEVYSTSESYNTAQVYTKTETDQQISTAVSAITALQGLTGAVQSVNGLTGVVTIGIGQISGLQSALDSKATTVALGQQNNNLTATINAATSTLNAAIALKADNSTLANYATVSTVNALSTVVSTKAAATVVTALSNFATSLDQRVAALENAGPVLTEARFVTGAATLAATDAGKIIRTGAATITIASNTTVPIPTNSWGFIVRGGSAGAVNVVAGTGVNAIQSPLDLTGIADQAGMVMWWKQAANTVFLSGDLG